MHELSITSAMIELCTHYAGGSRVVSVTLEIGDLSGVVPEAVAFCFEACAAGTPVQGARLCIQWLPARGRCRGCGAAFGIAACFDPCPTCGGYGIEILGGAELRVKELEVE